MNERSNWDEDRDPRPLFPGIGILYDLAGCLRFFTRLPIPALPEEPNPHGPPDFRRMPRMLPVAALLLMLPSVLVMLAAWKLGLGPFVAAALGVGIGILITGAMHEDGLADCADGFGSGGERSRMLEIMHDSRIGAYGGTALALSLALRLGALATLLDRSGALAAEAMLLAAAFSRSAALLPMALLPPARSEGASAAVGRPGRSVLISAFALCAVIGLIGSALGLPLLGVVLSAVLAIGSALALSWLAERLIGGQTGDVIGACQLVTEIAVLIVILIATPLGRA